MSGLPASARVVMDMLAPTEAHVLPFPSSSYVELFAQIAALQAKGDHYGLIQAAECADLAAANDTHPTRLLIAVPLVLSCLIVNDLPAEPSARFALMRLPDTVASLPLARATLNLFASVWERRYEHIYSRGEVLFNLAQQGDFSHTEVSGVLTTLVTTFIESSRQRTIELLSKAYTDIPLALAQVYLGLSADELLSSLFYSSWVAITTNITFATQVASGKGWQFDPTTHILTPTRAARKTSLATAAPSTFSIFNAVTENVARLEV